MMRRMLRVGLTGNIGCGKSTAAKYLADLGAYIIDADAIGHGLLHSGTETFSRIVSEFGPEILNKAGGIDRGKLGKVVFALPERLEFLNSLMHPAVRAEVGRRISEISAGDPHAVIIVESALMVETGFFRQFDHIIVVTCERGIQLRRTEERTGLTRQEVEARLSRQMSEDEKVHAADFVIDNSGSFEDLQRALQAVYRDLVKLEREARKPDRQ